jgi:hypothetical protein
MNEMQRRAYYQELGQRAIVCSGWHWRAGMMVSHRGTRLGRIPDSPSETSAMVSQLGSSDTPDLQDPATVGALLALVRQQAKDPYAHLRCTAALGGEETWELIGDHIEAIGSSEAEALIDALEIASQQILKRSELLSTRL